MSRTAADVIDEAIDHVAPNVAERLERYRAAAAGNSPAAVLAAADELADDVQELLEMLLGINPD